MSILTTILLILGVIIAMILIIAAITKKSYAVNREVIINAPLQKVFDYIRHIRNWDNFNKPAMADPNEKREFKGTDGTIGFIYAWSGNSKVGQGEKEIMSIDEGKNIQTEIRFTKPFKVTGYTSMATEALTDQQTKVIFSNSSTLMYPLNFMLLFVEKGIARDMDASLKMLKNILEK